MANLSGITIKVILEGRHISKGKRNLKNGMTQKLTVRVNSASLLLYDIKYVKHVLG